MGFDKKLKVTAICAVTLASNLVLASEVRVTNKSNKARAPQTKHVPAKPVVVTESVVEKPRAAEPSVVSEPILKQEVIPVEKLSSPLELKGVRG
ncbi:MAG: hypothetical protein WCT35_08250 [Sideroxydans sp.]|jgi:hypothetical protein